ncbi:MAG: hypothetical protein PVH00_13220, partial [Gemmatimonadota bacterium]
MYATIRTVAAACSILAAFATVPEVAAAQEVSTTLSLDEALDLARRNNPDYLISEHAASIADWNVREA